MIKRLLLIGALAASMLGSPLPARATTCTVVPPPLANGTVVDANALQTKLQGLATCANSIDNANITSTGIYASQIVCSTIATCTFNTGVPVTFAEGILSTGPLETAVNGQTPTSANNFGIWITNNITAGLAETDYINLFDGTAGTQAAHVFYGYLNSTSYSIEGSIDRQGDYIAAREFLAYSGTGAQNALDSYEFPNAGGYELLGANNAISVKGVAASAFKFYDSVGGNVFAVDTAGDLGILGNVNAVQGIFTGALTATTGTFTGLLTTTGPISATGGGGSITAATSFIVGSTNIGSAAATFNGTGSFAAGLAAQSVTSKATGSTVSYVPPVYSFNGTAQAATEHITSGTLNTNTSGSCTAFTGCTLVTNTVTFSGAGAFSSAGTYLCNVTGAGASGLQLIWTYATTSGTSMTLVAFNATNATISTGLSVVAVVTCTGT